MRVLPHFGDLHLELLILCEPRVLLEQLLQFSLFPVGFCPLYLVIALDFERLQPVQVAF